MPVFVLVSIDAECPTSGGRNFHKQGRTSHNFGGLVSGDIHSGEHIFDDRIVFISRSLPAGHHVGKKLGGKIYLWCFSTAVLESAQRTKQCMRLPNLVLDHMPGWRPASSLRWPWRWARPTHTQHRAIAREFDLNFQMGREVYRPVQIAEDKKGTCTYHSRAI